MKLNWSDVTPKPLWLNRRQVMAGAVTLLATPALARIEQVEGRLGRHVEDAG